VSDDFGEHFAFARFDRGFPAGAGDVVGADVVRSVRRRCAV
jgi:hypothetical protein